MRLIAALLLSACVKSPPETPTPDVPSDPMAVEIHTLANGLTVYLSPNREEPRIAARVLIRAGSAQDPRDATGMAHYLEHLLANKGTKRLGTLDYEAEREHLQAVSDLYDQLFETDEPARRAEIYASIHQTAAKANEHAVQNELKQLWGVLGGRGLNAFTSSDITGYVVDLPANRLEHWAHIEADRFADPVFRSFQTEVETVYEEMNRSLDNPQRAVFQVMRENLYAGLPYEIGTLGTIEHLKNPSVSKTRAYFDSWYVPSNMAVLLAGDFEPATALELVRQHLGQLPAGTTPERPTYTLEPLEGTKRVEVVHRGNPQVFVAWRTVPYGHPDRAALQVMDALVANGATGLFDRALVNPKQVREAASYVSHEQLAGGFVAYGVPRPGQTHAEVEALLLEQIDAIRGGGFADEDLAAVVRDARISDKRDLESNQARLGRMTRAFRHQLDWSELRDWTDRLDAVTRDDVVRVANAYLGEDRVVVHKIVGEPEIPAIEAPEMPAVQLNTTDHSPFFEEIRALPASALSVQQLVEGTDYTRTQTAAGSLYVVPNPFSDLFEITWQWDRGTADDASLCLAWQLWEQSGEGEGDLQAWEDWRFRSGIGVRTSCERHSSSLTLAGEADQLASAIRSVHRRFLQPSLEGSELGKLVDDAIATRREARATPQLQSQALGSFALQGQRSRFLAETLTDEAMKELQAEALLSTVRELWQSQATIRYVGTAEAAELEGLVVAKGIDYATIPARERVSYERPEANRVLLVDLDAVQATVRVYLPYESFDASHIAEHRLLAEYLGGSAGLLFQEIRESRGLAYSAGGGYFAGDEPGDDGLLWGFAACQADKTHQVVSLLTDNLTPPPEQPQRWERSKQGAIEKLLTQRIGFRSVASTVEAWRRMGLDTDPRPRVLQELNGRSYEELATFTEPFGALPYTIGVVGDADRIDMEALGGIAPVQTLTMDQLVVY
ncbi:MAG: insulinase family protein [Myxococcales bacterium]|nr:insulinase family protein [Myxococcales bacterium]